MKRSKRRLSFKVFSGTGDSRSNAFGAFSQYLSDLRAGIALGVEPDRTDPLGHRISGFRFDSAQNQMQITVFLLLRPNIEDLWEQFTFPDGAPIRVDQR